MSPRVEIIHFFINVTASLHHQIRGCFLSETAERSVDRRATSVQPIWVVGTIFVNLMKYFPSLLNAGGRYIDNPSKRWENKAQKHTELHNKLEMRLFQCLAI